MAVVVGDPDVKNLTESVVEVAEFANFESQIVDIRTCSESLKGSALG